MSIRSRSGRYEALAAALALRKAVYEKGTPMYRKIDTSPTGIGWVVNQEDEDGMRFPIRFSAKVKRELWGIVSVEIQAQHRPSRLKKPRTVG